MCTYGGKLFYFYFCKLDLTKKKVPFISPTSKKTPHKYKNNTEKVPTFQSALSVLLVIIPTQSGP